jgi:PPOX class probable F420-dependent enzyme
MIDETTEAGARAAARLRDELIAWLTTVNPAGQPQSSPVWFLWTGSELVLASLAKTPRAANIRGNPRVSVHLDSDGDGGDIVTIEGEARIDESPIPAAEVEAYFAKYDAKIGEYGWTRESMFRDYPVVIRIRPTRVRTW